MRLRNRGWRGRPAAARSLYGILIALCAIGAALGIDTPHPVAAHPMASVAAVETSTRPLEPVALARVALVRVLTYYAGTVNGDASPIPVLSPCVADGALVGAAGDGLNTFPYVLTTTAAVNPVTPCQGVQASFQQISGTASSWSITHIDVALNVAYTGTAPKQPHSIVYSISPAHILTNGGTFAPRLIALALSAPPGAPTHDLPVVATPQLSDTPPDPSSATLMDLTGFSGTPLAHDSITSDAVATTLYPIALPAQSLTQNSSPQASAPAQSTTAGTSSNAVSGSTPTPDTAQSFVAQVGLGAPIIDGNGRLIGMVEPDGHGGRTIASLDEIKAAIGPVTGKAGPLMAQWQQALSDYYAAPPRYSQAATEFDTLSRSYPDFDGVMPFANAARAQSNTIPSLTQTNGPSAPTHPNGNAPNMALLLALAGVALIALIALAVGIFLLGRQRRRATAPPAPSVPADEAMLDLLPRDMPLDALDTLTQTPAVRPETRRLEQESTRPLPAVNSVAGASDVANVATTKMPAQHQRLGRPRQGMALMPHAAGVTDPGIKRAADPNQDNILAVQGIRLTGGRVQPYGLFIVADGMGGHLNGQEASRLTIELMASRIMQTMNSSVLLDDTTLITLLRESLRKAGIELRARNIRDRLDMGTTVTAALVVDDMAYVANIGDSRTYIMSPETGLRQITEDHSVVASLVAAGVIRPEDVYTHPRRNQIYRSLGGEKDEVIEVDTFEVGLQAGDKLLLCSDGLWEMVRDPQIENILRGTADPQAAAELLVREANANGGEDNISAIVARLLEDVPQTAQPELRVLVAPQSV